MRRHLLGKAVCSAAIGVWGLVPQAQATIVDFESFAPSLFADGDSFAENGYGMQVNGGFGVVDSAASFFLAQAPGGNDTQFYAGLSDGHLQFARLDALPFRIDGFDAGFVAPVPQDAGLMAGRIQLVGIDLLGNTVNRSWDLGVSGDDGSFPFISFSGADFSALPSLKSADFSACVYATSLDDCQNPYQNLAQFALDNINVAVVPEPSTYALMALGLAGLALCARRRAAR
ncbi:MAG TPA: NF038120 family PEP-CTERM protein [Albitalea sp.]|nr:NF038120 family PEP-CTERM protein [Albitalea sp.]